jgi:osmotically-inducible protein OsmY
MKRSTFIGAFGCVAVVVSMLGQVHAEPGGERVASGLGPVAEAKAIDEALHRQVHDGWYKLSIRSGAEEVVLEGQVDNDRTREEVLSVARSVSSKPVRDQMRLKSGRADSDIQGAIKLALESEYPKFAKSLSVSVVGGVARLTGDLRNHREIDEVLSTTMMQEGVRGVESDITINGRPYATPHRGAKKKY